MELKTNYQYSYFIYPYIIDENYYDKYLLKLMSDEHCKLKIFEKEKDLNIYTYFLPKVRDYLFWSFSYTAEKKKALENLDANMKSILLSKYPCTIFDYTLEEDVQGKIGEENGIFFAIQNLQIVCFNTGICFLLLKTSIEGESNLSNVLNFNYKFRDINSDFVSLKDYENIRLQTNSLKDIKDLSQIIKGICGENKDAKEMNIEEERFFTYSYACLNQENWNKEEDFNNIKEEFIKFSNVLPSSYQLNYSEERYKNQVLEPLKFTKMGFTKQGTVLLTSGISPENYTKLPYSYEQEYLYTYILTLYKKIYLKKMNLEFSRTRDFDKTRNELLNFTRNIWIQEITLDDEGARLYKKWKETLELEYFYGEIKNKYDIEYKDLNIEKTRKSNGIIIAVLLGSFIVATISFIIMVVVK